MTTFFIVLIIGIVIFYSYKIYKEFTTPLEGSEGTKTELVKSNPLKTASISFGLTLPVGILYYIFLSSFPKSYEFILFVFGGIYIFLFLRFVFNLYRAGEMLDDKKVS